MQRTTDLLGLTSMAFISGVVAVTLPLAGTLQRRITYTPRVVA